MRKNHIAYALAAAPLLLGAGFAAEHTSSLTVNALPVCADGQYLQYKGGTVACVTLAGGGTVLPNCAAQSQLLTSVKNGDVASLGCIAKGQGNVSDAQVTQVTQIETKLNTVVDIIKMIQNAPAAAAAVWVGNTPNATKGQIQHAGNPDGIIAATATCNDAYAGSHMCTTYEMYNTAIAGKLKMTDTIAKAWIYAPAHHEPIGTPSNANLAGGGEADNCGSYTYPTADRVWTGTAVEWKILPTGGVGFVFSSGGNTTAGTSAYCHDPLPIACCK